MSNETRQQLTDYGVNVEQTLGRFSGNEGMMLSFMAELPQEESYAQMMSASQNKQSPDYQNAVHALKGVCGSLGLTPLFDIVCKLMDALRADDISEAERLHPQVVAEFSRACDVVKDIDK